MVSGCMKLTTNTNQAEEFITISLLIAVVFVSAIFTVVSGSDIQDVTLIAVTAGLVLGVMFFLKEVDPAHLLYTLCLGVSFLPYINLQMFPLSGVYVVALLFVITSLLWIYRSGKKIQVTPQAKWMTAFLVIGILSAFSAPDKKATIIYAGQFFLYICIYVTVVNVLNTKTKVVRALRYILYGSVVTIFLSLVQFILSSWSIQKVADIFFNSFIGKLFVGTRGLERIGDTAVLILNRGSNVAESSNFVLFRVFGTFEGPTIFGWYLLLIGVLSGGLYIIQTNRKRIGLRSVSNITLFLMITVCLVFTWTRSALLVFVIVLGFILIYRNKWSIRIFTPQIIRSIGIFILGVLLLIGLLILFQVPVPFKEMVQFNVQRLGGSVVSRLLTMLFALLYFVHHPIIGIGMGNYKYVQPSADIGEGGASFATAHNTFLELGVELGLPGLIIFILLLRSFLTQASALTKASVGSFYHTLGVVFYAIWIGFILISMFGGNLVHPRFMTLLWILAGIQTASYYLFLDDKEKENTVYRLETAH